MKIKKLSAILLILLSFCFVGCNVPAGPDIFTRTYEFDNYEEYKTFYDNFCLYNTARFIVPKSTEAIEFNYYFHAIAMEEDRDKDELTLSYLMASTWVEVKNLSGYTLHIEAYDVYDYYDNLFNDIAEIKYMVEYDKYNDFNYIYFCIDYARIARVCEVTNDFVNAEDFSALMDKILVAYKGGE